jgi:hypothetical protein
MVSFLQVKNLDRRFAFLREAAGAGERQPSNGPQDYVDYRPNILAMIKMTTAPKTPPPARR